MCQEGREARRAGKGERKQGICVVLWGRRCGEGSHLSAELLLHSAKLSSMLNLTEERIALWLALYRYTLELPTAQEHTL